VLFIVGDCGEFCVVKYHICSRHLLMTTIFSHNIVSVDLLRCVFPGVGSRDSRSGSRREQKRSRSRERRRSRSRDRKRRSLSRSRSRSRDRKRRYSCFLSLSVCFLTMAVFNL